MKTSQKFFLVMTPIGAMTIFVVTCICSVGVASRASNEWEALLVFAAGAFFMALFTLGMQWWNEQEQKATRTRTFFFYATLVGLEIMVTSGLCYIAYPLVSVKFLFMTGGFLFAISLLSTSMCGLILRVIDAISR